MNLNKQNLIIKYEVTIQIETSLGSNTYVMPGYTENGSDNIITVYTQDEQLINSEKLKHVRVKNFNGSTEYDVKDITYYERRYNNRVLKPYTIKIKIDKVKDYEFKPLNI